MAHLAGLSNPLATVSQLSTSASQLDGVPKSVEDSARFDGALLTQAAGIVLKLPQEIAAQAVVLFTRFYTAGAEGGTFRAHNVKDISAASVYLVSKLSALPQSPRSILNVYAYLTSPSSILLASANESSSNTKPAAESYSLSESSYLTLRTRLLHYESVILRSVGFNIHITLPHHLALYYIATLGVVPKPPLHTAQSIAFTKRVIAHLNTALLSPQVLYLTHQPSSLGVAAVYLAARETGVKLPEGEWWRVMDVEREELGFLVLALTSMPGWSERESDRIRRTGGLWTIELVEREVVRLMKDDSQGR